MNNYDLRKIKELFARIFVLAVQNKINFDSFTYLLERSLFVRKIEKNEYDDYFNKSLIEIFQDITNLQINEDNSFGIFNDAYWCGYSYFDIYLSKKKSFAFIFLKLPFKTMIEVYSIFHEMDISSLLSYFDSLDQKKTILRLLCEKKRCSLTKLSNSTGINPATIAKYNSSDELLYKASFQNIFAIAKFFDSPISLFATTIISE